MTANHIHRHGEHGDNQGVPVRLEQRPIFRDDFKVEPGGVFHNKGRRERRLHVGVPLKGHYRHPHKGQDKQQPHQRKAAEDNGVGNLRAFL